MKKVFFQILALVILSACSHKEEGNVDKPNIILIYADDLGAGLLSHEGQQIIKTPHIDRLAEEGIRFQNAYSAMLCAPARASLITGLHDCHAERFEITSAGIYEKISTGASSQQEIESMINSALSPVANDRVFLGEVAQKAGYTTAQVGKLEWGFAATHQQMKRHGWDYYLGYLDHVRAHGFYPPFLFENGQLIEIEGNTLSNCGKSGEPETEAVLKERWDMTGKKVYSQTMFMDTVLGFIEENKDKPFFLYFPTQLPHGPVSVPVVHPDFAEDQRLSQIEKEYASMVKMLDEHVGQIMQKLKTLGLDDNTIVIFTSDNGHEIYYSQKGRIHKPYTNMQTGEVFDNLENKYYSDLGGDVFDGNKGRAGLKRSNLQGGIEVPLIVRWPERIRPGRVSKRLVANYDLLPTIAGITGFSGPLQTDGISFLPELNGETSVESGHDFVVYASFLGPTLITREGWKIRTYLHKNIFELYYLPEDYREEKNLAEKYPERLEELKSKLISACDGDLTNGLYSSKNLLNVEQKPPLQGH
ncbi:arylsulfatase [Rapidithrix thailandica]|uniref:Arylsulfatase n=1 Tax=Rapidithrix thailandica TaxID=413964 RepID=A0AAW9SCX7_9BACT